MGLGWAISSYTFMVVKCMCECLWFGLSGGVKRERETDVVIGCTKDNKTINMTFIPGRDGLWGNWLWGDVNCVNNFYP